MLALFASRRGAVLVMAAAGACLVAPNAAHARPHRAGVDVRPETFVVNVATDPQLPAFNQPLVPLAQFSMSDAPLRVSTEMRTHREITRIKPTVRLSEYLAPGDRKTVRDGVARQRVVVERVTRWNSIVVARQVIARTIARAGRAAVILKGAPRTMLRVVATAYTGSSSGYNGGGQTATGARARYGVVAVDPRLIPLGTRLFIPGYGHAIAADTGGAITGHRIDLCMDSLGAALSFGRQAMTVYVLGR
ncbi:MAG: hypothetical protein GIW99_02300 [Candidatus Eremiobacteraeota bacterium]|nr:hypothetical protein [Candidatus Eremiobacteraeota bacterium]MBC5826507.1 hypothetical protein [Candidatus Eremiobacteraeota bacterium]